MTVKPRFLPLLWLALPALTSILVAAEPLYEGLGNHSHRITTRSPAAQQYFDQGLRLLYGFNHGAAIRSFQEAARFDPTCAMAHWGIALASGPHINFPLVPPPAAELAWRELGLAQQHAAGATAVERDLIAALAVRYANPQPDDRGPLDRAYADAMRKVWQAHPDDADVGALFAEAMMDLRPWDQWTPDGQPQPGTDEILATLDAVLKRDLQHPFANHLYIHAVEASAHPERALAAAERLADLQPGLAHNVHMPSHIYIRVGRWQEAIDANLKAVAADRAHRAVAGPPHGFLLVYIAHNEHMLAYAAMMTGQRTLALEHIKAMVAGMPEDFLKEYGAESFAAMPYEVLVRFGRWDEILAEPEPPDWMPFTRAMRHAARAIALAAKGDPKAARAEQALFTAEAEHVPADEIAGNNTSRQVLTVAVPMVEGEILYREGRVEEGLAQLRAAVKAEDALRYDEPPGWLLPVRHSLGATLMQERRYAEAEQVYRDDLRYLPNNGWSLFGLAEALRYQRKHAEAEPVEKQFKQAWAKAEVELHSSCLCQPGI
jgi:tetratricopeptide (TPR) repeat protein